MPYQGLELDSDLDLRVLPLMHENERLRKLVQDLLDNDPNEAISDAGHTVLDLWRHDARKMLSRHSGADVVRRGMGEK
jgi:hypothetical protein